MYYKFTSAKDYASVMIDGHFISVAHLKEKILESKHLGKGNDFNLLVTNAHNNEGWFDYIIFFKTFKFAKQILGLLIVTVPLSVITALYYIVFQMRTEKV
ncbi:E3 ubiquitin ligase PARAQUAT TOLERANCE 3-like isoform X2, partial [Olea europaea subsp. europaea]